MVFMLTKMSCMHAHMMTCGVGVYLFSIIYSVGVHKYVIIYNVYL